MSNFEIVELEQSTKKWHIWRAEGIGASDAPAIMNENPWKSQSEVKREKLNPTLGRPMNAAMERGTQLEPIARASYCDRVGFTVYPACIQSVTYPWMRASLDGLSVEKGKVVEIKCGESVYKKAARFRQVPNYYYGQLQHALAILGYASVDFWCFLPGYEAILLEVPRDESYIVNMITEEE
jgi:putative phage-type endonuclease